MKSNPPTEIEIIDCLIAENRDQRAKALRKQQEKARRVTELDRELDDLHLQRRRALLPTEPGDGRIVRFTLRMGARSYLYAAIHAGNRWWRTGATCPANGETWAELIEFIRSKGGAAVYILGSPVESFFVDA